MITTFEPKSPVPQMTTIFIWNLLSVGWKQLSLKSLAAVRQGRDSCTAMSRATLSSRRSSGLDSARQPEPFALVLNQPSCYHFRVFDPPRLPLRVGPSTASKYGSPLRSACPAPLPRSFDLGRGGLARALHLDDHALVELVVNIKR